MAISTDILNKETDARFWLQTGHNPGEKLDPNNPTDKAFEATWRDVYRKVKAEADANKLRTTYDHPEVVQAISDAAVAHKAAGVHATIAANAPDAATAQDNIAAATTARQIVTLKAREGASKQPPTVSPQLVQDASKEIAKNPPPPEAPASEHIAHVHARDHAHRHAREVHAQAQAQASQVQAQKPSREDLYRETDLRFWQTTHYKPGQKLDRTIPEDLEKAKVWDQIFRQVQREANAGTLVLTRPEVVLPGAPPQPPSGPVTAPPLSPSGGAYPPSNPQGRYRALINDRAEWGMGHRTANDVVIYAHDSLNAVRAFFRAEIEPSKPSTAIAAPRILDTRTGRIMPWPSSMAPEAPPRPMPGWAMPPGQPPPPMWQMPPGPPPPMWQMPPGAPPMRPMPPAGPGMAPGQPDQGPSREEHRRGEHRRGEHRRGEHRRGEHRQRQHHEGGQPGAPQHPDMPTAPGMTAPGPTGSPPGPEGTTTSPSGSPPAETPATPSTTPGTTPSTTPGTTPGTTSADSGGTTSDSSRSATGEASSGISGGTIALFVLGAGVVGTLLYMGHKSGTSKSPSSSSSPSRASARSFGGPPPRRAASASAARLPPRRSSPAATDESETPLPASNPAKYVPAPRAARS